MLAQLKAWQRYAVWFIGGAVLWLALELAVTGNVTATTPAWSMGCGGLLVLLESYASGDLVYWLTGNETGRERRAEENRREREGTRGIGDYLGVGIGAAFGAATLWYGGWALLAWLGIIGVPVRLGYWWWGAVVLGVYVALKEVIIDLRRRGRFPQFFAFWGPYRTAAAIDGIAFGAIGLIAALIIVQVVELEHAPPAAVANVFSVIVTVLMGAFGVAVGLAGVASKRGEYPFLASPAVIMNGALVGVVVGWFSCVGWARFISPVSGKAVAWTLAIAAALGAAVNLWWRFSNRSGFGALNVVADGAGRIGLLIPGLWYMAVGCGMLWLAWQISWDVVRYAGIAIGLYFLARGVAPVFGALSWSRVSGDTHGKGRTATATELHRAGLIPRTDGIYLGKFLNNGRSGDDVGYPGAVHLITIGPTGSGKGTGVIMPNLSALKRSLLIIDPKGEAAAITGRKRAQLGRVVMLNPFQLLVEKRPWLKSDGFNPLATLDKDSPHFADAATGIAEALVRIEGTQPHWSQSAQDVVAALVMYEVMVNGRGANLGNVRSMLTEPYGQDREGNPIGLAERFKQMELTGYAPLRQKIGRLAYATNEMRSILSSAMTQTRFLDSPPMVDDLAGGEWFDFASMKEEIVTVYLILPATHLITHSNWLRLIIASALRSLLATPASKKLPPVLFLLDEFAQLGELPAISNAMNIARSFGVQLWPIVQDLGQLKAIYRDGWENFVGSCGALTSFAPRDLFTAEYLSRRCGYKTVIVEGESERTDATGMGRTRGPQGLPVFRPEELMGMPERQMLCFVEPVKNPFMTLAPPYWETDFNAGLDPNPYHE